jgi:hypothetical protein
MKRKMVLVVHDQITINVNDPPVNDVSRDFFWFMNHDGSFFRFMDRKFWLVIISMGLISRSWNGNFHLGSFRFVKSFHLFLTVHERENKS